MRTGKLRMPARCGKSTHVGEYLDLRAVQQGRGERIRDVRVGADGAVYVLTDEGNGKLLRLTPPAR